MYVYVFAGDKRSRAGHYRVKRGIAYIQLVVIVRVTYTANVDNVIGYDGPESFPA